MSEEGKPLHVRVAEVLGTLRTAHAWDELDDGRCYGCTVCEVEVGTCAEVWQINEEDIQCAPSYDTDWAAAGPLIEEFKLDISPTCAGDWEAGAFVSDEAGYLDSRAAIPLEAVCNLILKLKEAGRL